MQSTVGPSSEILIIFPRYLMPTITQSRQFSYPLDLPLILDVNFGQQVGPPPQGQKMFRYVHLILTELYQMSYQKSLKRKLVVVSLCSKQDRWQIYFSPAVKFAYLKDISHTYEI